MSSRVKVIRKVGRPVTYENDDLKERLYKIYLEMVRGKKKRKLIKKKIEDLQRRRIEISFKYTLHNQLEEFGRKINGNGQTIKNMYYDYKKDFEERELEEKNGNRKDK